VLASGQAIEEGAVRGQLLECGKMREISVANRVVEQAAVGVEKAVIDSPTVDAKGGRFEV
jgi:hypothetical protein